MNKKLFIKGWSLCVGLMDTITGLLLIFAPSLVLKLLGITASENDSLVFLSWMGVFITSVGISYFWALEKSLEGKLIWKITAMVRLFVAAFILWKVSSDALNGAWLLVAISDAFVAAIQILILRCGWWKELDP